MEFRYYFTPAQSLRGGGLEPSHHTIATLLKSGKERTLLVIKGGDQVDSAKLVKNMLECLCATPTTNIVELLTHEKYGPFLKQLRARSRKQAWILSVLWVACIVTWIIILIAEI